MKKSYESLNIEFKCLVLLIYYILLKNQEL